MPSVARNALTRNPSFVILLLLSILFIIHWALTLLIITYVFWRRSKRWDWLYFVVLSSILCCWFIITHKECIISLWEKQILDHNYKNGTAPAYHPSLFFYSQNVLVQNTILMMISGIFIYNSTVMMFEYGVPIWIVILLGLAATVYVMYFQVIRIISEKQNRFLDESKLPQWLSEDDYLMGIYKRKVDKPVGFNNVVNVISCHLLKCNPKQLLWTDFEKHVNVLLEKLGPNNRFDYVVGIESGGAFVSKVLSERYGIPVRYVKASKYDDGGWRNIDVVEKSLGMNELRGKRVLLCDDQVLTGDTLRVVRDYLIGKYEPASIITCVLYARFKSKVVDENGVDFTVALTPWGSAA